MKVQEHSTITCADCDGAIVQQWNPARFWCVDGLTIRHAIPLHNTFTVKHCDLPACPHQDKEPDEIWQFAVRRARGEAEG